MTLLHGERLFAECERRFGFAILETSCLPGGYLNEKWLLKTDAGCFVLKQYHPKRYKHPAILHRALLQQQRLHKAGIPCPQPLEHDGAVLLEAESGTRFMVMEFCEGERVEAGSGTEARLYELGRVIGRMHQVLNDGSLGTEPLPLFVPPRREERLAYWEELLIRAEREGNDRLAATFELHRRATERMDWRRLQQVPSGWAHRDLWSDNLLFREQTVAAVLDFDRLHYEYPEMDLARALLSLALKERGLDAGAARACLAGYRESYPAYSTDSLVTAIHLLYCMESEWWIRPDMEKHSAAPARFALEMNWLAGHLEQLDDLLASS